MHPILSQMKLSKIMMLGLLVQLILLCLGLGSYSGVELYHIDKYSCGGQEEYYRISTVIGVIVSGILGMSFTAIAFRRDRWHPLGIWLIGVVIVLSGHLVPAWNVSQEAGYTVDEDIKF